MVRGRRDDIRVLRRTNTARAGDQEAQLRARARRFWWSGIAGLVIVASAYAGAPEARRRLYQSWLPALPDLSAQPASIGGHLREADRVARANPTAAEEVGALCLAYHADLFYDQADRCYAVAEHLRPEDWHWTYYRALAQNERGNGGALVAGMRRVVARAPEYGPAWWRLGEAEFKFARYDQAEEAWRHAASAPEPPREAGAGSPEHVPSARIAAYAALGLARVELLRGAADHARQILETVTSSAPRFGPAFRVLADSYAASGRTADAERALGRANHLRAYAPYADPLVDELVRESHNSTFLLQQAAEADATNNADWAEYVTRRALEFDTDNPDALYQFGSILRIAGRGAEALEFFQRYRHNVPDDFKGLGQIGVCLTELGRFAEAEPLLRQTVAGLDDAGSHYNLGVVLAHLGRPREAIVEYERALDRDPQDVDVRSNLATVLVRQGNLNAASRQLARALELDPDNASVHTNLGLVLAQQGQIERAAGQFRESLRLDPRQIQAKEALQALGR